MINSRTDLERRVGDGVRRLAWLSDRIGQTFAARQDLHPTDFRALSFIYEAERSGEPLTASGLAAALNLGGPAVTYAVDRLVASGHVVRERDAADRRRVVLKHAPHGHEVASEFFIPLGRRHHDALTDVSDADLATFLGVLDAVADALAAHQADLTDGSRHE